MDWNATPVQMTTVETLMAPLTLAQVRKETATRLYHQGMSWRRPSTAVTSLSTGWEVFAPLTTLRTSVPRSQNWRSAAVTGTCKSIRECPDQPSIVLTSGVTPPLSPTPPSSWWSPLSWPASSCKEVSPCRGRWMLGYCQACCKMCFTNIQTDCTQIRQDLCINWYHYHW